MRFREKPVRLAARQSLYIRFSGCKITSQITQNAFRRVRVKYHTISQLNMNKKKGSKLFKPLPNHFHRRGGGIRTPIGGFGDRSLSPSTTPLFRCQIVRLATDLTIIAFEKLKNKYLFSTRISIFLRKTSMWLGRAPSGLGHLSISIVNSSARRPIHVEIARC